MMANQQMYLSREAMHSFGNPIKFREAFCLALNNLEQDGYLFNGSVWVWDAAARHFTVATGAIVVTRLHPMATTVIR
jgi:hypothetical protein